MDVDGLYARIIEVEYQVRIPFEGQVLFAFLYLTDHFRETD